MNLFVKILFTAANKKVMNADEQKLASSAIKAINSIEAIRSAFVADFGDELMTVETRKKLEADLAKRETPVYEKFKLEHPEQKMAGDGFGVEPDYGPATLDAINIDDLTLLASASYSGNEALVDMLLAANVKLDMNVGRRISRLTKSQDPAMQFGTSALAMACISDHPTIAIKLLKAGASTSLNNLDDNPLMCAAALGRLNVLTALIDYGKNIFPRIKSGAVPDQKHVAPVDQPVLWHRSKTFTALIAAASFGQTQAMQMLTDSGEDVNERAACGDTALMEAARNGHIEAVDLLIKRNAKLDAKNNFGDTALIIACDKNQAVAAEQLVLAGADTRITNYEGDSALHCAMKKNSQKIILLLVQYGAPVDITLQFGITPLMHAAFHNFADVTAALIKRNVALDAKKNGDQTALTVASVLHHTAIATQLLQAGANTEIKDAHNCRPLNYAISGSDYRRGGSVPLVCLLLSHGADIKDNKDSLKDFLNVEPESPEKHFCLALLHESNGDFATAGTYYERAREKRSPEAHRRLGELHEANHNDVRAVSFYRRAARLGDFFGTTRWVTVATRLESAKVAVAADAKSKQVTATKSASADSTSITEVLRFLITTGLNYYLTPEQWSFLAMNALKNPVAEDQLTAAHFSLRLAQRANTAAADEKALASARTACFSAWSLFGQSPQSPESRMTAAATISEYLDDVNASVVAVGAMFPGPAG